MAKTRRLLERFRRADQTAGDSQTQPARVDPAAIEAREGNVDCCGHCFSPCAQRRGLLRKITERPWRTTLAPILTSRLRSVASDQCLTSSVEISQIGGPFAPF